MSKLLVTGGAGFIGSNFVNYWRRQNPADQIVVIDALTYAVQPASFNRFRDDPKVRLIQGDIRDQNLVEKLLVDEQIQRVVHFAAESHVDRSIIGPDPFIETNIVGTHSLLKAARNAWADRGFGDCRFHHISTDEVYGSLGLDELPFTEASPYCPNSTYSASKASSDHLVRAYHKTYDLPVVTTNSSNNYGPFQFPEKLIPLSITNLLNGKSIPIYGDGRNIRDWLHVVDHCRGIHAALKNGKVGQTYNIGGNCELTNKVLIEKLCGTVDKLFGNNSEYADRYPDCPASMNTRSNELITYVEDRPGHDRRYAIDATKIAEKLGFSPMTHFDQGLEITVKWYLENDDWWRPILDGSYRKS